jgi:hypothetical protein
MAGITYISPEVLEKNPEGITKIPPGMMDLQETRFPRSKFERAARNSTAEAAAEIAEEEETRKVRISTLESEIRRNRRILESINARLSTIDISTREYQTELERADEINLILDKKIKEIERLRHKGGRRRRRTHRKRPAKRTRRMTKRPRAK